MIINPEVENAQRIIENHEKQWQESQKGKYYKTTTEDQKNHINVIKMLEGQNGTMYSEVWFYYNKSHYGVRIEIQYMNFMKTFEEITKTEYYDLVSQILIRLGIKTGKIKVF